MVIKTISNKTELTKLDGNDNQKLVYLSSQRKKIDFLLASKFMEPANHLHFQVVLEFMVSWSELCKFMEPAVQELAQTYEEHADFHMLDTDKFKVPCSLELISYGITFFSHNKTESASLSAAEAISPTARQKITDYLLCCSKSS